MAAAPSANDLTRQQLDELDALLQRMLTLPLSPGEQPSPQSYAQAPALRLTAAPPEPVRPFVFDPPPLPAPEPTTPIIERKVVAPSTQIRSMPIPAASRPATSAAESTSPAREPVSFLLWPLVAVNWLFDSIMGLFGPPGWLVRSGLGKNLLGFAGAAMILLTVAHVGTQQGWFALPFRVPWPR